MLDSEPGQVMRLAQAAEQRFGRVDTVINNAGIHPFQPFGEMTFAD